MADHRPDRAPTASAKATLKRIPGLVAGVRHLRTLWRRAKIAVNARAIAWGNGTRARRLLVFEALPKRLVLAPHPQESYVVNTADKVIGRSLYANGQFDFQKFEIACQLIRAHTGFAPDTAMPRYVLIDAGANIGSICIPAVRRGLVERAIAFELDPDNVRLLRINAILNAVDDRIDIRNMALGAAPGQVAIRHSKSNFGDHRVFLPDQGPDWGADQGVDMAIAMVALDSIANDLDLSRIILWMDIQGYEVFALQGAQRFMAAGVPLITEFSREELDSTGSFETFLSIIAASGYEIFYDLNDPQPEPAPVSIAALRALSDRLERQKTFTDLLFLPDRTA